MELKAKASQAFLLAAAFFLASTICLSTAWADELSPRTGPIPWDGTVATGFQGGTGTQGDPYRIASGSQLAYLAQQVYGGMGFAGSYFQLSADIDLDNREWLPIGSKNASGKTQTFAGSFDGKGHSIANLKITMGRTSETYKTVDGFTFHYCTFGATDASGNAYRTTGDNKIGLFGYTSGTIENFTIENVSVDGTQLECSGENGAAGGATAAAIGNSKDSSQVIRGIHVGGTVSIKGNCYVAGILGYHNFNTLSECSVMGDVSISGVSYVGGIIGGSMGNAGARATLIDGCTVGDGIHPVRLSGAYCVGGIGGAVESSTNSTIVAKDCTVKGGPGGIVELSSASGRSACYFAGGIFGKTGWGSGRATLVNCSVAIDISGTYGLGGMVGYCTGGGSFDRCSYGGAIAAGSGSTAHVPSLAQSDCAGVIVGATAYTGKYEYAATGCTFEGTVADKSGLGAFWVGASIAEDHAENKGAFACSAAVSHAGGTVDVCGSLSNAISKAQAGDTVTLVQDVDESVVVEAGRDVVLDLNGKTIAGPVGVGGNYLDDTITVEGKLTVKDSTGNEPPVVSEDFRTVIYEAGKVLGKAPTAKPWAKALHVQNGGSVVIESGIVESQDSDAVFVSAGSSLTVTGGFIHSREYGIGVQGTGATLEMKGGVVVADNNAAVGGNGTNDAEHGDTNIEITGGTVISHSASSGYIACGIYHPQRGTLNISGGTVYADGGVGVLIRGGTLNMTNGIVTASGATSGKVGDSKVVQNCYGVHIDAASRYYDHANSKVSISGGRVESSDGVPALSEADADGKLVVTGGSFSSDVSGFFDGDAYVQNAQDASEDAGAVVPRVFGITYDLTGGALADGAGNPATYTHFDDTITLVNPVKAGYTFAGWTGTGLSGATAEVTIPAASAGERSYIATWTANTNTPYTVKHLFQNVEGDGYTVDEAKTQSLAGTTDADTVASALTVTGFKAEAFDQQRIVGNGSTVVEIHYDRNVHTVSYAYEGGVPVGASVLPTSQQLRFGAPVVAAADATAVGYTFSGWGVSENMVMPDEDIQFKGSFTANGDTPYTVEHYQQALDGTYVLADAENPTGETDATATAGPKTYPGFACNKDAPGTVASGVIAGDGSLTLKLYYDRVSYEVSYAYAGTVPAGAPGVPEGVTARFGETVTPAAVPAMTGYAFSGWSHAEAFAMPAENVAITGSWTPNTDVSYTVRYYLDGTTTKLVGDKVVEGRTFGWAYNEQAPAIEGYTLKGDAAQSVTLDAYGKEVTFFYTANEARIAFVANGGSPVADFVGKTGEQVVGSLPAPTRDGYAFAGWYAEQALKTPVTVLLATYPVGMVTYYAKWNAVPLPDAPDIQVEVSTPSGEGSSHATVSDETVKAAAESAQNALGVIKQGGTPSGVAPEDADAIARQLAGVEEADEVSVVVSLAAEVKGEGDIDPSEKDAIEGAAGSNEEVSLFLDLSVTMSVVVKNDDGVEKSREEASLAVMDEPLLFEVHVDPALIKDKVVRIAYVHDGVTTVLVPESIDRENGIIRFYASEFSTYALLTSETCTVSFESNGGSAVESQSVVFGGRVIKPADPTRDSFAFAGWFADEGLAQAYDFAMPVEQSTTLYAKWTAVAPDPGPGIDPLPSQDPKPDVQPGGDLGSVSKSEGGCVVQAKPLPKASDLTATGDVGRSLAAGAAALAMSAAATLAAVALRRRRSR